MISEIKKIENLFKELDKLIDKKINIFVIGGMALMYRKLKNATKDIDIIVETKEEFQELQKKLKEAGFNSKRPEKNYSRMNLSQIFHRDDFRIDLFQKTVCQKLSLSKAMTERAETILKLNKIKLSICSNEDIFLFKTITDRKGDLEDCMNIAKEGIDWNIFLKELNSQIKKSKQDVWITWICERLELLEDKGLRIPIIKEVHKEVKEFYQKIQEK